MILLTQRNRTTVVEKMGGEPLATFSTIQMAIDFAKNPPKKDADPPQRAERTTTRKKESTDQKEGK